VDLPPNESVAVREFASWLRERFGSRVRQVALFGSRARGEGGEDSDVDVLVVVDELAGPEAREIGHAAGDTLTRYDVLVSPFAVSTARLDELRARERLIAQEIDRDAVPL
jgi:predicted nucleotidyltransferase